MLPLSHQLALAVPFVLLLGYAAARQMERGRFIFPDGLALGIVACVSWFAAAALMDIRVAFPRTLADWMPWWSLAAGVISVVVQRRPLWLQIVFAVAAFIVFLVLSEKDLRTWSLRSILTVATIFVAWMAMIRTWHRSARVLPIALTATTLAVAVGAAGIASMLFYSQNYGIFCATTGLGLAGIALVAWFCSTPRVNAPSLAVCSSLICGAWLLIGTQIYYLPWWAALLIACAGAAPQLIGERLARRPGLRLVAALGIQAVFLLPVLAMGLRSLD